LVNSLAKNKEKLRSLSNATRRSRRDSNLKGMYFSNEIKRGTL
jgi:hypothetical protein